jgi:hypothetical protein
VHVLLYVADGRVEEVMGETTERAGCGQFLAITSAFYARYGAAMIDASSSCSLRVKSSRSGP